MKTTTVPAAAATVLTVVALGTSPAVFSVLPAAPAAAAEQAPAATRPAPTYPASTHHRPVPGEVLSPADIPAENWRPGHRGVDLAAEPGSPVRAGAAGTVRFAGVVAGTPTVSVDHGDGLRTTYEPVLSDVSVGDRVVRGDVLGTLADTATLPESARHEVGLHWGAVVTDGGERYIDPMTLLGPVRVRLWR